MGRVPRLLSGDGLWLLEFCLLESKRICGAWSPAETALHLPRDDVSTDTEVRGSICLGPSTPYRTMVSRAMWMYLNVQVRTIWRTLERRKFANSRGEGEGGGGHWWISKALTVNATGTFVHLFYHHQTHGATTVVCIYQYWRFFQVQARRSRSSNVLWSVFGRAPRLKPTATQPGHHVSEPTKTVLQLAYRCPWVMCVK